MLRCKKDITGRYICYDCECCDIASHRLLPAGDRIYEDDYVVVYTNMTVPLLGFIVVAPKKHVSKFSELDIEYNEALIIISMRVVDALKSLGISEEFSIIKMEEDFEHCRIWVMPYLNGIFENGFDFTLIENRYSLERRKIPISDTYEILYLNRRLRSMFENQHSAFLNPVH